MTGEFPRRVHLVGAGGVHMSAIGLLLRQRGIEVSGSDLRASDFTERLQSAGAEVSIGHRAENVGAAGLVVATAAASDDNPEIAEAHRRGIPVLLRAEMVARLMSGKRVIAVAGSHGKTTTSSLIAYILREAGRSPMYLLGGDSRDLGGHAAWGDDLCVVEADEYRRAFLEYEPEVGIVTNVEPDHLDYYGTPEAYEDAFVDFARRIVVGGRLYWCVDDAGARRLAARAQDGVARLISYGTGETADWRAIRVTPGPQGTEFDLVHSGDLVGTLRSTLPGEHVVRNATVAAATCLDLDVPYADVARAVEMFHGAHRRFEQVGEANGVLVMDDYAHHPTEVRATLRAARDYFPARRILAVYQPHTYSRIAYLWQDWLTCWEDLDTLVVLETYAAREAPAAGRSASDLARAIAGLDVEYAAGFEEAAGIIARKAQPGDVVFTIGAGDVDSVGPLILEALR